MQWQRITLSQARVACDWLHSIKWPGKASRRILRCIRNFWLLKIRICSSFFQFFWITLVGQDSPGPESPCQNACNNTSKPAANGDGVSSNSSQAGISCNSSFASKPLLAQRKIFAESQIGRSSFQKLLEPSLPQRSGIAPYRIVLGNVKEKVLFLFWASSYLCNYKTLIKMSSLHEKWMVIWWFMAKKRDICLYLV